VTPLFPGQVGSSIGKDVRNGYKSAAPPGRSRMAAAGARSGSRKL